MPYTAVHEILHEIEGMGRGPQGTSCSECRYLIDRKYNYNSWAPTTGKKCTHFGRCVYAEDDSCSHFKLPEEVEESLIANMCPLGWNLSIHNATDLQVLRDYWEERCDHIMVWLIDQRIRWLTEQVRQYNDRPSAWKEDGSLR